MKHSLAFAAVAATFFMEMSAFAESGLPASLNFPPAGLKETPALRADLTQVDAQGVPVVNSMKSVLVLNKAGEKATSFTMSESRVCPPGMMCTAIYLQHQTHYKILWRQSLDCGSFRYFAISTQNGNLSSVYPQNGWLNVIDHTSRICDDHPDHLWNVKTGGGSGEPRFYEGDPVAVSSNVDCAGLAQKQMCNMIYAPATCAAPTLGGASVQPPLSAQGSNSCFAALSLRVAACERGYDADQLQDSDIQCLLTSDNVCPTIDCAAPPRNCHYSGDTKKDDRGCGTTCGDLVCGDPR